MAHERAAPRDGAPRVSIERTALEPGAALASTPADRERAVSILEGAGEAEIDGRRVAVAEGDNLRLPPGAVFAVRNTAGHGRLVLVVAAPCGDPAPGTEGAFSRFANRLAWVLRRIARRLAP
ncbi:MAG: cupin domain-containing protein [Burkholderiales bacterium]